MFRISVLSESSLIGMAIMRLLALNPHFQIQHLHPTSITQTTMSGQDIIMYCSQDAPHKLFQHIYFMQHHNPKLRIVIMVSHIHRQFLKKLNTMGIHHLISYKSSTDELLASVYAALEGRQFISSDVSQMFINQQYDSPLKELSKRELEIACLLADGLNIKHVSSLLNISPKTVSSYRNRVFNKLHLERSIDLIHIVNQENTRHYAV